MTMTGGKKIVMLIIAVLGTVIFCHAKPPSVIRKMSVDAVMTAAPDINYRSHNAFATKNLSASKWVMIKVDFTPDTYKNFVPSYKRRKAGPAIVFPGWLDDVKIDVQVVFETGINSNGKPVCGIFTGSTVLWSVRRDGKSHLVLFFIPARLIDRYCVPGSPGGRGVNKSAFYVQAKMSCGGSVLATAYGNVSGASPEEKETNFRNLVSMIPQELKFPNALLPRSKSPWALLAPDNFDLEKEGVMQK